ncbi:L-threonylcarbamoyladenylate synthase [Desulfobotulus sp. H1]|uniref:L-threonylcarbamoyladenylate synthase n=1 Tax=Desulfobotulus pelophilus TaxID=2823377 RepID=A0ABT3NAZ9_9BACT|nr:L-threonylcarbamoyladenylate synthase [Desulfobotulus pelophilus]MCW7754638.1 L-threonylcarbamoyladenylate synthase [Desulfobotulus pelophilus]
MSPDIPLLPNGPHCGNSYHPSAAEIEQAALRIRAGGLVIFPTFCLYGMGVDALRPMAIEKVFKAKGRPGNNPLLILAADLASVMSHVKDVSDEASLLMKSFWPGRLTLVLKAKSHLPAGLTAGTGKIGIRIPEHPVAAALVRAAGGPITGTSANLSGQPGVSSLQDLSPELITTADCVLDAGILHGGPGSTVVDATSSPPLILREGALSADKIFRALAGKC